LVWQVAQFRDTLSKPSRVICSIRLRHVMEVVDLPTELEPLYFVCLADWSPEIKEMGTKKERWYRNKKEKGLRVKVAKDGNGVVGGMIHYLPIEESNAEGRDLYFVNCIWVHRNKQGRGDFTGKGMGTALLKAAEQDAKSLGAKGMVAWGLSLPAFMRASWFKKHGYTKIDRIGAIVLLWKPFTDTAQAPKWIRAKKTPGRIPGKVSVACFVSGWCPSMNIVYERAKRAAAEFGDRVEFTEYDTLDRRVFHEWGMMDALFVDDREVRTGPPPSYDKIRKKISKRIQRL